MRTGTDQAVSDNVCVVDYALLLMLAALELPRRFLSKEALASFWKLFKRHGMRRALSTIAFWAGLSRTLHSVGSFQVVLLTSNSFVIELLRFFCLSDSRCKEVCEILHGTPTIELEEYLSDVIGDGNGHTFIRQIPGQLYGVYESANEGGIDFAINGALNLCTAEFRRTGGALRDRIKEEQIRYLGNGSEERIILAFMGGTSPALRADSHHYCSSEIFIAECSLMTDARNTLMRMDCPFTMSYSPHPAHNYDSVERHPFFAQNQINVYPNSLLTWLFADLVMGIHSGALFEASYAGARVFSPVRVSDSLYPAEILGRLSHPDEQTTIRQAFLHFIESNSDPRSVDLLERAQQRAQRLGFDQI